MTAAAASKQRFRWDGVHLDDLADGRTLEPGQVYTLTASEQADPHNAQRIESGLLLELAAHTNPQKGGG